MKTHTSVRAVLFLAIIHSSCAPMSTENAGKAGAVAGVAGGAAIGGIQGKKNGNTGEGLLQGAFVGGMIGHQEGRNWFNTGDGSVQNVRRTDAGN